MAADEHMSPSALGAVAASALEWGPRSAGERPGDAAAARLLQGERGACVLGWIHEGGASASQGP